VLSQKETDKPIANEQYNYQIEIPVPPGTDTSAIPGIRIPHFAQQKEIPKAKAATLMIPNVNRECSEER
jgi:hypothetical protein